MKALRISRFGAPEVLELVELPSPALPPDSVRIRVKASGVNFADLMMRMGLYPEAPKPPFVPGYEIAGEVIETGNQVTSFSTGDRVLAACRFGGYVDEIVLPALLVKKIPPKLSDAEAAAVPINFMTAWIALHEMGRVRAGDRVVVPSAAGGVGIAAVQLAKLAGAEVTGLVGSSSKEGIVRELGATHVVTNDEWESKSFDRRYDIVMEAGGGASLKNAMRRLAPAGRVVTYGLATSVTGRKRSLPSVLRTLASTPLILPFQLMMKNQGIFGLNLLSMFEPQGSDPQDTPLGRAFDGVLQGFHDGKLRVVVGKTFPLKDGAAAHEHLLSRANIGKVVLTHENPKNLANFPDHIDKIRLT